jgi:O-methyltransferase
MKLTSLKSALKQRGVAACRFQPLTEAQKRLLPTPEQYDVFQSPLIYCPWTGDATFLSLYEPAHQHTLASADRCWVLYSVARQAMPRGGEVWECGVYRGGTALLLRMLRDRVAPGAQVRLFDSFAGMPDTLPDKDTHCRGDFADTSVAGVQAVVGTEQTAYHPGFVPATFAGLESSSLAFAHVDLDIYEGILESCRFIYPRLVQGGAMVFDDYGFPSCPGARLAVDEFFADLPEVPLVLPTGQAVVHKV